MFDDDYIIYSPYFALQKKQKKQNNYALTAWRQFRKAAMVCCLNMAERSLSVSLRVINILAVWI